MPITDARIRRPKGRLSPEAREARRAAGVPDYLLDEPGWLIAKSLGVSTTTLQKRVSLEIRKARATSGT